jgi:hypothetical protein
VSRFCCWLLCASQYKFTHLGPTTFSYFSCFTMASNFGDVTVVGDAPIKHSGEYPFNGDTLKGASSSAKAGLSQPPRNDFKTNSDYGLEERPFFVPIANGGVLAALQKLDRQLLNVGSNHRSHALIVTYQETSPEELGCFLRNNPQIGLARKSFLVK